MNIVDKQVIQRDRWQCQRCKNIETVETMLADYPDGTGSPNQKVNLKEVPIWNPKQPSGWVIMQGETLCQNCYQAFRNWIKE